MRKAGHAIHNLSASMIRKTSLSRLPGIAARQESFPFINSLIKPTQSQLKWAGADGDLGWGGELMMYADVDGIDICGRPQRGLHNDLA